MYLVTNSQKPLLKMQILRFPSLQIQIQLVWDETQVISEVWETLAG